MKRFSATYSFAGVSRTMTFEAADEKEATTHAAIWGVGVVGEVPDTITAAPVLPDAYDMTTACRLLGGVSRETVRKLLILGQIERVPEVRRVLITRRSLERFVNGARN